MTATLLDLQKARDALPGDLAGLHAYLAPLLGEPFRFARVSYGDELTLHFGDLRPARSAKLPDHRYGAYVLGVRGSAWLVKSGRAPLVLSAGLPGEAPTGAAGTALTKERIEADPLIESGARVVSAAAFAIEPSVGFGLRIGLSDGSTLQILPTPVGPAEGDDATLPELADWELASPNGLLRVGPGNAWAFEPT